MQVSISFSGNSLDLNLADGASVDSIVRNPNYAAALGFDAGNVEAYVNGAAFNGTLRDGDKVTLQQKAHKKA